MPASAAGLRRLQTYSERKRAEQRQQLLLNELKHRAKNALATVQSIAVHALTDFSGMTPPREF